MKFVIPMKCSHLNCVLAYFACSTSNLFRKTTLAYMRRNMRSHTHSDITRCRPNILPPTFMLFLHLPPATSPCRQIQSSPGIFYKCVIASFPSVYKKNKNSSTHNSFSPLLARYSMFMSVYILNI